MEFTGDRVPKNFVLEKNMAVGIPDANEVLEMQSVGTLALLSAYECVAGYSTFKDRQRFS
ncbi:hypothetical protein MD484_g8370, partial [Candolleomyces efflorescens]